eukprot:CAMPEP_0172747916 /NCGR_PEP_ID=MMETSP1074-20121228/143906_1 /TAXON_ID=2916 /ORGANISM="Ceratium fusus, Strain PA161109" /LENGTH=214 /DNA_ID=CAMNT_0013579557 /DNA_START=107 /DNA_END=748 /DNA_ORIENTATION=+
MAAKRSCTWSTARDAGATTNNAVAIKAVARVQLAKRMSRFATIAGFLCILDCTALPIVVLVMQLSGFASPSTSARLHELGHKLALYFVLPIGGTATLSNFLVHRRLPITFGALLGLAAVFATNGHGGPLRLLPGSLRHQLHHGVTHKVVNLLGCALLIGSNYVSHRMAHAKVVVHAVTTAVRHMGEIHMRIPMEEKPSKAMSMAMGMLHSSPLA